MDKNTILVVMPIYNAERTLGSAIESILNQTYRNFKLILVDDSSTDNSLNIAKSYTYDKRVELYFNKENRGAYYSRNLGLYKFKDKPWGFFTTHDADDMSFPDRFQNLVRTSSVKNVNGVQDVFERIDYKTQKIKSRNLTIAHALFKRKVFEEIGYFELVRFGADWEYWARLTTFNSVNKMTTKSFNKTNGKSFILENNLTVQIPINSPRRKKYVETSRIIHQKMKNEKNFYIDFKPEPGISEKNSYRSKTKPDSVINKKINKSNIHFDIDKNLKTVVVLLTWKRIKNLPRTMGMLYAQKYKNFDIHITNANLETNAKNLVEKYAVFYTKKGMNVSFSHDGNEIFAFRRLTVGREMARKGYSVVLFIDDDVTFPSTYVQKCLQQYEPKSYKSGFAWTFYNGGESYYKYRERRWDNNKQIHYCGTGISMVDSSIFLEKNLIQKAPKAAYKIEDLWLSYYVQHVMNWKLEYMETPGIVIGGSDDVALYKQIQKDATNKDHFLLELVKMGWKIPK
jgi:glycosyltransferase involved in cell wall biosynthesis